MKYVSDAISIVFLLLLIALLAAVVTVTIRDWRQKR